MSKEPIEGNCRVPWEPLAQVSPDELLEALKGRDFVKPFKTHYRGNGHEDLFDADGVYIAHVYCWDKHDFDIMKQLVPPVRQKDV